MTAIAKVKIALNIVLEITVIIYTFFLKHYNEALNKIREQYENVFLQAWNVVAEERFWGYCIVGAILAIVLFVVSRKNYRSRNELEKVWIILIVLNMLLLIELMIVYSNPVFTSLVICVIGIIILGEGMGN